MRKVQETGDKRNTDLTRIKAELSSCRIRYTYRMMAVFIPQSS